MFDAAFGDTTVREIFRLSLSEFLTGRLVSESLTQSHAVRVKISYGLIGRFSNGQLQMGWSRFLRATTPPRARQGPTFVLSEIRCTSFPVPSPSLAPASGTFYHRTLENMMRVRLDGPVVLCQSSDLRHMLRLRGMRLSPNLRKGSGSRAH